MKKGIILIFAIFSIGIVIYFGTPSEQEVSTPNISTKKPEDLIPKGQKLPPSSNQAMPINKTEKNKNLAGFSLIKKNQYFKKIRDTIKDQWNELEECENEFDLRFGELLKLDDKDALVYLNDPNNLDNFLENVSSFNMTTPSSAKMIKQLAEPITNDVEGKEILDTVGYVKTCRSSQKSTLVWFLLNIKNKNQITALATIGFFENENSTLTYPNILFKQIFDIKSFLENYGIDPSTFLEISQIETDYAAYSKRKSEIYTNLAPENQENFNSKAQKEDYDFAVKLQSKIKLLLGKVKTKFI